MNYSEGEGWKRSVRPITEKWRSVTKSYQGGEKYRTRNKKKANFIGRILRRTGLLKHIIVGKTEARIEVTERRR
jgi:S-adenosylmethionine:diacylglycerol 3-amino-3-carboxypropyl transferase